MKNWKRLLSLTMATAMSASMVAGLTAGASFADIPENHSHESAISLLTSLGVIDGFDDGTFKPDQEVTREQYVKMLFVLMNGSNNADMYKGTSPFPDVAAERWSAPYINWAKNLGIIHGDETGDFAPERKVSFAEASKMYVTGLGYEAKNFTFPYGFIDKANSIGLFEGIPSPSANGFAKRGEVAEMGSKVLFVEAPRFSITNGTVTTTKTPAEKVFNIVDEMAVLDATSNIALSNTSFTNDQQIALGNGYVYDYESNIDGLLGQEVKIYFKDKTTNGLTSDDNIINVTKGEKNKVYTVPAGAVNTSRTNSTKVVFSINGKDVTIDYSTATVLKKEAGTAAIVNEVIFEKRSGQSFTIVDTDGDGNAETIYVSTPVNTTVSYIDNKNGKIMLGNVLNSMTNMKDTNGNVVVKAYENPAKDDAVRVYSNKKFIGDTVTDSYEVVKSDIVKGAKLTSVNGTKFSFNETEMNYTSTVAINSSIGGSTTATVDGEMPAFVVGSNYDLYLDANGNIYKALLSESAVGTNEIVVTKVAQTTDGFGGMSTITLTGTLADGTSKTFKINLPSSHAVVKAGDDNHEVLNRLKGWADNTGKYTGEQGFDGTKIAAVNNMFKYSMNADGEIIGLTSLDGFAASGTTIKKVVNADTNAYTDAVHVPTQNSLFQTNGTSRIGYITSDTLVYVIDKTKGEVAVVKGDALPKFATTDHVDMIEAVIRGAEGTGTISKLVLEKAGTLVATGTTSNVLVTGVSVIPGVKSGEVIYRLNVINNGESIVMDTASISQNKAIWTNAAGVAQSLDKAFANGSTPVNTMVGYVKIILDTNGKIDSLASLKKDAAVSNVGDSSWGQGIVSRILPNGIAVNGTYTLTYNTGDTADVVDTVNGAETVLVFDKNVKFYSVSGTPTGGDTVGADYVANDSVKLSNKAKVEISSREAIIESTSIGQVGGVHFFVDYVMEKTADGDRVTSVYIYNTPLEK